MPTSHNSASDRAPFASPWQRLFGIAKRSTIWLLIAITLISSYAALFNPQAALADPATQTYNVNISFGDNPQFSSFSKYKIYRINTTAISPGVTNLLQTQNGFFFTGVPGTIYTSTGSDVYFTFNNQNFIQTINLTIKDDKATVTQTEPVRIENGNGNTDQQIPSPDTNNYVVTSVLGGARPTQSDLAASIAASGATPNKTCNSPLGWNPFQAATQSVINAICGVTEAIISSLSAAMGSVVQTALEWTQSEAVIGKCLQLGNADAISSSGGSCNDPFTIAWAPGIYNIAINLVNYLIVLVLLFLSFVNILHINIDTYGIKKIMPTIVVAVILANFSLLICRFLVDFADVITVSMIGDVNTFSHQFVNSFVGGMFVNQPGLGTANSPANVIYHIAAGLTGASGIELIFLTLVLMIFGIATFLIMLALLLLFVIRYYMLIALAAISPLAFAALATPMTESYFKSWWSQLLKWTFMAPVAFFILNIASIVSRDNKDAGATLANLIFMSVLLYFAVSIPLKLGSGNFLASGLNSALKWAGKKSGAFVGTELGISSGVLGKVTGWKNQRDESVKRRIALSSGGGAAAYEIFSRTIGALKPGKGFITNPAVRARIAAAGREQLQMAGSEDKELEVSVAYETQNREGFSDKEKEENLATDMDQAVAAKDLQRAAALLITGIKLGVSNTDELQSKMQEGFVNNPRLGQMLGKAAQASRESGRGQIIGINQKTGDKGEKIRLIGAEKIENIRDNTQRRIAAAGTAGLPSLIYDINKTIERKRARNIDLEKDEGVQGMLEALRSLGEQHPAFKNNPGLRDMAFAHDKIDDFGTNLTKAGAKNQAGSFRIIQESMNHGQFGGVVPDHVGQQEFDIAAELKANIDGGHLAESIQNRLFSELNKFSSASPTNSSNANLQALKQEFLTNVATLDNKSKTFQADLKKQIDDFKPKLDVVTKDSGKDDQILTINFKHQLDALHAGYRSSNDYVETVLSQAPKSQPKVLSFAERHPNKV